RILARGAERLLELALADLAVAVRIEFREQLLREAAARLRGAALLAARRRACLLLKLDQDHEGRRAERVRARRSLRTAGLRRRRGIIGGGIGRRIVLPRRRVGRARVRGKTGIELAQRQIRALPA